MDAPLPKLPPLPISFELQLAWYREYQQFGPALAAHLDKIKGDLTEAQQERDRETMKFRKAESMNLTLKSDLANSQLALGEFKSATQKQVKFLIESITTLEKKNATLSKILEETATVQDQFSQSIRAIRSAHKDCFSPETLSPTDELEGSPSSPSSSPPSKKKRATDVSPLSRKRAKQPLVDSLALV